MTAQTTALQARRSTPLTWLARVGFTAYGVVYLVLAWLTVQVLLAHHSRSVSRKGALHTLAQQPLGTATLWIAVVGFAALVLWQACNAVAGHSDKDGAALVAARAMSAFKGVVFATLAVTTAQIAAGAGSSSSSGSGSSGGSTGTRGWTARLLELPLGQALVTVVGLVILGYAGFSAYKGLSDRWHKELEAEGRSGDTGRVVTVLARTGYVGRGLAFAVIGVLLVWAALTRDPRRSGGLDRALESLRQMPFGIVLLAVIAAGFACYGAFNLAKARHLRH